MAHFLVYTPFFDAVDNIKRKVFKLLSL